MDLLKIAENSSVKIGIYDNKKPKSNTLARGAEPKFIELRNALSLQHNGFQRCQPKTGLVLKFIKNWIV